MLQINRTKFKRWVCYCVPYVLVGLTSTKLSLVWRTSSGFDLSAHIMCFLSMLESAFQSPWPSIHPADLMFGAACGCLLRLAVYLKGRNAKKYRRGVEYGSARWGTLKDIAPFEDPTFSENIILTKTERLAMSNRPKNPKYARNKNVLVVGGSGSGKTRYWLKPNLLQICWTRVLLYSMI